MWHHNAWTRPRGGYTGVGTVDDDADGTLAGDKAQFRPGRAAAWNKFGWRTVFTLAPWLLCVALVGVIALQDGRLREDCFVQTSAYSPLLGQVPHRYTHLRNNGSLDWPSVFRGEPSPEIDDAWDSISIFRPLDLDLSEAEYLKFGRSLLTAARNAPEHGGGFFVQPEFSHQLHCVNLLRKSAFHHFPHYQNTTFDFRDMPLPMVRTHVDHCVEMLRQFVMCHADVGLVAAHWIEGSATPWPDFNTEKVCRNFEEIVKWTRDHQLPKGTPPMPRKPMGAEALAVPP